MTTISATVVADSVNIYDGGQRFERLTTLRCRYPRIIHSEVMTHRLFSRNAASSRAIPVKKMIAAIKADPFVPLFWGKNQRGMQATEECNNDINIADEDGLGYDYTREEAWEEAMGLAIKCAEAFAEAGYHKQIVNRLLEPFMHIEVLISATQWSNFLALRDHPAAEPHIAMLARAIRKALNHSHPRVMSTGDWHLPYVTPAERTGRRATGYTTKLQDHSLADGDPKVLRELQMLSVARCAHLSYETVGTCEPIDLGTAQRIYEGLVGSRPIHASPAEHVAQTDGRYQGGEAGSRWNNAAEHGNFVGFRQYRKMLPGECIGRRGK